VWYPAQAGSEAGKSKAGFKMKEFLPELDPSFPDIVMNAYWDLPLDTTYGPYPIIIFVHGFISFRYIAHINFAHWASRGFVVLCADNPKMYCSDVMDNLFNVLLADQVGDTKALLAAVRSATGPLAFLNGNIDAKRIGLVGHSWGGEAIKNLGDEVGVRVIISLASGRVDAGTNVESALLIGGLKDNWTIWRNVQLAYDSITIKKKRLVGIPDAGHMVFTSICDYILLRSQYGVDLGILNAIPNDGCGPEYLPQEIGWDIVNYASTAAFEETLQCSSSSAGQLDMMVNKYQGVGSADVVYDYTATQ